eukprot:6664-Heterococcus_DN1.PRE.2
MRARKPSTTQSVGSNVQSNAIASTAAAIAAAAPVATAAAGAWLRWALPLMVATRWLFAHMQYTTAAVENTVDKQTDKVDYGCLGSTDIPVHSHQGCSMRTVARSCCSAVQQYCYHCRYHYKRVCRCLTLHTSTIRYLLRTTADAWPVYDWDLHTSAQEWAFWDGLNKFRWATASGDEALSAGDTGDGDSPQLTGGVSPSASGSGFTEHELA